MALLGVFLTLALFSSVVDSITYTPCKGQIHGKLTDVSISDCGDKIPCILKRGTQPTVEIHFNPNNDIEKLHNKVFAKMFKLPLPFMGVDGTPACDYVYQADGTTFAGCPLKANTDYVYRNSIDIHGYYLPLKFKVHWALQDSSNRQDVVCFEVESEIKP